MSADKRGFVNFREFDGSINTETNNYEFPMLFAVSDSGKMRQWNVYVRLIKESSKKATETKTQNWNLLAEDQVPIKNEYLDDDVKFPDGILAQVWTEGGYVGMKISRSAPTYTEIKNKGKKNERNVFHQAIVVARGKFLKKREEGCLEKEELEDDTGIKDTKYFPMLAKNAKDVKKVNFPIYVQPKLDGLRCVAYLDKAPVHKPTHSDVILYTRQKKEYPSNSSTDAIRAALLDVLMRYYNATREESVYLDGELYKHGKSLQNLNSATRGTKQNAKHIDEYHVYDMFYPSYHKETFETRTKTLSELHSSLDSAAKKVIKLVPTVLVHTQKDVDKLYYDFLDQNYEGAMLRNPAGAYAKSSVKKSSALRSKNLLKRKEVYDAEFEVVGFTEGKSGKDVGALIWICETKENNEFNVTPNMSHEDRYKLYKDCEKNFVKKYKSRMLTVEYRGLSDNNIPQHAKGIAFRID